MAYYLRIYDNYHYMSESEAYDKGIYETYKEAEDAAKKIVEESLKHMLKYGATKENLLSQYKMFGDDPVIKCRETGNVGDFSAWTYAGLVAEKMK
jgi:hypothetical protein